MRDRCQIIIDDWIATEAKRMAKRYGMSLSEVVRASLCSKYLENVKLMYPQYKPALDEEATRKIINEQYKGKEKKEKTQEGLSKLYFETRKAIEFVNTQEAGQRRSPQKLG